jgi:hypothetical protein
MKLRIKGNSLRLRVTRSELARLLRGEEIEETVRFGPSPEARLSYALVARQQSPPVSVDCNLPKLTVALSKEQAKIWSSESEVGVYASLDAGSAGPLEVIVEKDFACLDRSDEDNADTFANPHADQTC